MADPIDRLTGSRTVGRAGRAATTGAARLAGSREDLYVFGSNAGEFYADNAKYLYEWVLANEPDVEAVWMTKNRRVYDDLRAAGKPVEMVLSRTGISTLLRADTGFFTHSTADIAPDTALVPDSLRLVNLRHGESVKNTQLCPSNPELVSPEKVAQSRRWRASGVTIAATSPFVADVQRRCLGVSEDQPVVTGYPRHDPLWTGGDRGASARLADQAGFDRERTDETVLYAPTWRQYDPVRAKDCYTEFLPFEDLAADDLSSLLERHRAELLFRPHPHDLASDRVHRRLAEIEGEVPRASVLGPDDVNDVYEILPAVDVLVTDYSSLYHDYLPLDRPIVLVPYDVETFAEEVGFVYDYEERAPGPRATTWAAFERALDDALSGEDGYGPRREDLRDLLYEHQDGEACRRLIDRLRS
ncbi:CDP-glycerol glycerophosphotransferase family protein [Saliphagus infecundisoli]|uniref:CDP-glycerol glycerophosphotransferase family protein n=1 Tax=Saliphagus infecundisoli TaxID=1849069 RepID=A0ABD5QFG8_9EURY|nr:CDP-glycerol glycerophosphotransferase family protein [Saliphagus infecundisoli]